MKIYKKKNGVNVVDGTNCIIIANKDVGLELIDIENFEFVNIHIIYGKRIRLSLIKKMIKIFFGRG